MDSDRIDYAEKRRQDFFVEIGAGFPISCTFLDWRMVHFVPTGSGCQSSAREVTHE
jgi:hypothetical protein